MSLQKFKEPFKPEKKRMRKKRRDTVFINVTDILNEKEEDSFPPHQRCACHTLNVLATRDSECFDPVRPVPYRYADKRTRPAGNR